jgi:hypothetical protein
MHVEETFAARRFSSGHHAFDESDRTSLLRDDTFCGQLRFAHRAKEIELEFNGGEGFAWWQAGAR